MLFSGVEDNVRERIKDNVRERLDMQQTN